MIAPAASAEVSVAGRAAVVVRGRVEEAVEQRDVVVRAVGVDPRDGLRQHRVAEAVDGMGELGA